MAEDRGRVLGDQALDVALRDLRPEFPPTPDLAAVVQARIQQGEPGRSAPRVRLALLLGAALVLLTAGAALAGALGVGPLRILFSSGPLPSANVPNTPLGVRASLGEPVDPPELPGMVAMPLMAPAGIGEPDEAYLSDIGIASLVWNPGPGLPEVHGTGIGLLVMEIPGSLEPSLVEKVVIESRAHLDHVTVAGVPGYWISGAPHVLRYLAPDRDREVTSRLVEDALVWELAGTVFRIESRLGMDEVLRLADSFAAWPSD